MIYGKKRWEKHRVKVVALHGTDGGAMPLAVIWDDGRRFEIDSAETPRRRRCERTGGFALGYPVSIKGRMRILWRDEEGWFVEALEGGWHPSDPRRRDIPC